MAKHAGGGVVVAANEKAAASYLRVIELASQHSHSISLEPGMFLINNNMRYAISFSIFGQLWCECRSLAMPASCSFSEYFKCRLFVHKLGLWHTNLGKGLVSHLFDFSA